MDEGPRFANYLSADILGLDQALDITVRQAVSDGKDQRWSKLVSEAH